MMPNPGLPALERCFWPQGFKRDMWMVVDAARNRRIFTMLVNSYLDYSCLYSGTVPYELEVAAPYLVQLEYEDRYTRRLLEQGWGEQWGIVLRCDLPAPRLRRHLREFLTVRDPRGRRLVFRYYDPRVLRVYLPTCNSEELRTFFGPITRFYTESADPDQALEYSLDRGSLVETNVPLVQQTTASP